MTVLTRSHWAAYVPHAEDMALIDEVHAWDDAGIHASSHRHVAHTHPLRSASGLHAVHLAEYAAQATAVHGALVALAQAEATLRPGRLVSLRDLRLLVEYVDLSNGPLDVHAQRLAADDRGAQYSFNVEQNTKLLAAGRVAVMHTDA